MSQLQLDFPANFASNSFWTGVHLDVQGLLSKVEREVRRVVPDVDVVAGKTRGDHFLLFSYLTFSPPGDEIDPVVVGLTFTGSSDLIHVRADASGERSGDLLVCGHARTAPCCQLLLFMMANDSVADLGRSLRLITAALTDPSRHAVIR